MPHTIEKQRRPDIVTIEYPADAEVLAREEAEHDRVPRAQDGWHWEADCWNSTEKILYVVFHKVKS